VIAASVFPRWAISGILHHDGRRITLFRAADGLPDGCASAFFAFCLTACMVCWGRPRWVAWPFFVIGGGMIPEISMFRSDWSKFRTLFGAGRIDFARFQREYLDQEGQFGQLTEKDLVRLKYRVESGWEWDG